MAKYLVSCVSSRRTVDWDLCCTKKNSDTQVINIPVWKYTHQCKSRPESCWERWFQTNSYSWCNTSVYQYVIDFESIDGGVLCTVQHFHKRLNNVFIIRPVAGLSMLSSPGTLVIIEHRLVRCETGEGYAGLETAPNLKIIDQYWKYREALFPILKHLINGWAYQKQLMCFIYLD